MVKEIHYNKNKYWIKYTIAFIMFGLIIFSSFILKRNSLIRSADGFDQTYPVLVYIGEYIRDFFRSGQIKQYDFRLGFGESIITSISWLGFGDIFTLLSVFIPKEYTEYLFDFIVVFKMYLSGVTFSCFCFYHNQKEKYVLTGALMYVFSRFSLIMGPEFYQFLNPMVWLPFLFLGIDRTLSKDEKERKISYILILTVFIQAVNGFYFLYMETVLCVVYFLIRYFTMCGCKKGLIDFLINIFKIAWHYLLGLCMGAFIFIPAVIGYFNSTKTSMNVPTLVDYLLYSFKDYVKFIQGLFVPEAWENYGLGIPFIVFLFILLIFSKNYKNKSLRALVLFFICAYITPLTGSVLNGFSYSSDRWFFILYFLVAYIFVDIMNQQLIPSKFQIVLAMLGYIFSLGLYIVFHIYNISTLIRGFLYVIIFLCTFVAVYLWSQKKVICGGRVSTEGIVIATVCFNVIMSGFILNAPVIIGGSGYSGGFSRHGEIYTAINNSQAASLKNSNEFGRNDVHDTSRGASMVLNYNGTSEYFSIINKNISEFFMEMAISSGIMSAANALEGLDSRIVLEGLLSVEYIQDSRRDKNGVITDYIIKNPYKLPLGFTYDSYMSRDVFDNLNELEKMDTLISNIILEESVPGYEKNLVNRIIPELPIEIEYSNIKIDGNTISVNENSEIKLSYNKVLDCDEGELYVKIDKLRMCDQLTSYITIGNKKIQVRDYNNVYYIGKDDFLVHVQVPEDNRIIIAFDKKGTYEIGDIHMYWYPLDLFTKQFPILNEKVLENVVIGNNQISGDITLDEDKILFLSIPYDSSWIAEVDGLKTPIYRANIGFMGIPLKQGQHVIKLYYSTPGIKVGGLISTLGLLVFFIVFIREKKERRRKDEAII
ncbi:YfhO family protein [Eisenbergiella sp.]